MSDTSTLNLGTPVAPPTPTPSPTIPNSAAQGLQQFVTQEAAGGRAVGFDPYLDGNDLILNYGATTIDLGAAVKSMELERTIEGASTLKVTIEDPYRVWLNHPALNISQPITPTPPGSNPLSTTTPVTGALPGSVSPTPGLNGLTAQPGSLASQLGLSPTIAGQTAAGTPTAKNAPTAENGIQQAEQDLATNAGEIITSPYRPTTVSITNGKSSLTFALVEVDKQADELNLTFEDVLVNELRYAFAINQGSSGLTATPSSTSTSSADGTGGADNIPAGGEQVGASMYGGPTDPSSSTTGAGGNLVGTFAFAELSTNYDAPLHDLNYDALGNLPMGTLLEVTYNGRSVIAQKLDKGAGGPPIDGEPRAIDLWYQTAAAIGFTGTGIVTISPAPAGAAPGPVYNGTAASSSGGGGTVVANTGVASGQTRADFLAMVINTGLNNLRAAGLPLAGGGVLLPQVVMPQLVYPPDGTPGVDPVTEQLTWGGNGTGSSSASSGAPGITEDAWSCLVRLANEAQWRVFSDGTAIWFGPDSWLLSGPVAACFIERASAYNKPPTAPPTVWDPSYQAGAPGAAFGAGVLSVADDISFNYDVGKAQADLTVSTVADLVTFPPGRVVAIYNCGLASGAAAGGVGTGPGLGAGTPSGPLWIVSDTTRQSLAQPDVTIECVMAQPAIDENMLNPQATNATATDTGATGAGTGGSAAARAAVNFALKEVGVPYQSGGETPGVGFDCSGLTQWSYAQAGVTIPRTSQAQYSAFEKVDLSQLLPGDLLYAQFGAAGPGPDHVGMYIGNGQCIQSPHTGASVFVTDLASGGFSAANRPAP